MSHDIISCCVGMSWQHWHKWSHMSYAEEPCSSYKDTCDHIHTSHAVVSCHGDMGIHVHMWTIPLNIGIGDKHVHTWVVLWCLVAISWAHIFPPQPCHCTAPRGYTMAVRECVITPDPFHSTVPQWLGQACSQESCAKASWAHMTTNELFQDTRLQWY